MRSITIGTRASKLALTQTRQISERLLQLWPNLDINIEHIQTTGDHITNLPLAQIGGDGVFVKEIEHALRTRRIDLAVHSLKDVPTAPLDDLRIIVTGPREDVRDVLISHLPVQLTTNNLHITTNTQTPLRIGTSSLRRAAQIRTMMPNAHILPIRGNVDTRLRKMDQGDYDAILLAAAGLHRLSLQEPRATQLTYLPVELLLPAPGQGALALEIRDEPALHALLAPLHDPQVQATTSAERMFLRELGAGCYLPVAAYGEVAHNTLTLTGLVISLDGRQRVQVRQQMAWTASTPLAQAEALGMHLAALARDQGAAAIIAALHTSTEQERQHV